jgi:hypothetical protein
MSKVSTDIRRTSYDPDTANPDGYVGTLDDALAQIRAQEDIDQSITARGALLDYLGLDRASWQLSGVQQPSDPYRDYGFWEDWVEDDSVEYRDPPPPVSLHDQGIGSRLDALNDQQMEVYWAARVRVGVREALAYAEAYPYPAVRQ